MWSLSGHCWLIMYPLKYTCPGSAFDTRYCSDTLCKVQSRFKKNCHPIFHRKKLRSIPRYMIYMISVIGTINHINTSLKLTNKFQFTKIPCRCIYFSKNVKLSKNTELCNFSESDNSSLRKINFIIVTWSNLFYVLNN